MSGAPGAGRYLWEAQGCTAVRERHDEMERAGTLGDGAAYLAAAERTGEAEAVMAGGALSQLGLTAGESPTEKQALALLRCLHPETENTLGSKLPTYRDRDTRLREAMRGMTDLTEEQARAITREVDQSSQVGRAFYDLTYSAPKSVSVYWSALRAAGEDALADAVLAAHNEAAEYATDYLEANTWIRTGRHGRAGAASTGRHERPAGLIRLAFQHSTSRATDPHLHTHTAVINRAPGADGKWRALHALAWDNIKGATAARYEQKLAQLIEERTPARFFVRDDGVGREIAGIDPNVLDESSQRTRQVLAARDAATEKFRVEHGREPSPQEQRRIHRTAGLESRAAKSTTAPSELLDAWAQREGIAVDEIVADVHRHGEQLAFWGRPGEEVAERSAVREALAEAQAESAAWRAGELAARIALKLPAHMMERADELAQDAVAEGNTFGVVDLTRREPAGVPAELVDTSRDQPVWRDPALANYALADHLTAETQLAASARAHTVTPWTEVEIAAVRQQWADDPDDTISEEQAEAVAAVLRSPRAGDVLIAAAGAGKSFVAGRVAKLWAGRGREVLGTATSQVAANVLADEGVESLNATRLLMRYGPAGAGGERLPEGTLLVFDEANMTSTEQLRRVQAVATRDRCKVLFFGDPKQLDAVGAGGALSMMARENGQVAELTEARRFVDEWEKTASTRLRDGDMAAVDEYMQRGRIHGGEAEDMLDLAVDRYVADVLAGHKSALITATNADAAHASALVQQRLAALGVLDGTVVGDDINDAPVMVGDRIQWRENVYEGAVDDLGQAAELTNREFLRVDGRDGSTVRLVREDTGERVWAPAEWLESRAALGYSGTEHAFEGVTVDTGHSLIPGYVAMTRGKLRNEAWLTTHEGGDAHGEALETNAHELFAASMSAAGSTRAAIEQWRDELEAGRSTANLGAIWEMALPVATREALVSSLGTVLGEDTAQQLATEDTWSGLMAAAERAGLDGHDLDQVLSGAVARGPLEDAKDLNSVLRWRIDAEVRDRQPERTATSWAQRSASIAARATEQAGGFLSRVGSSLDDRISELGRRCAEALPEWARAQLGAVPQDQTQRDEWQQRAGTIAAYREHCGISDSVPSVGARPHRANAWMRRAWRDAARAGGRPVDELTYQAQPDSALEATRARWRLLSASAPAYVEPELARAHDQRRQAEADAVLLRHAAEQAGRGDERAELESRAAGRDRDAQIARSRVEMLQQAHEVRQSWLAAHEHHQDAALEAERELKRRGVIVDGPEMEPVQHGLFGIPTRDGQQHGPVVVASAEPTRSAEVELPVTDAGLWDADLWQQDLPELAQWQPEMDTAPVEVDMDQVAEILAAERAERENAADRVAAQQAEIEDEAEEQAEIEAEEEPELGWQFDLAALAEQQAEIEDQADVMAGDSEAGWRIDLAAVAEVDDLAEPDGPVAAAEVDPGRTVDPERAVDDGEQQELFAVEVDPADEARQQTLVVERDEDQAVDRMGRETVLVREAVGRAADARDTLAEIETRTRLAAEQVARRHAEREAAAAAEAERHAAELQARQVAEQEAEAEREAAAEQQLSL